MSLASAWIVGLACSILGVFAGFEVAYAKALPLIDKLRARNKAMNVLGIANLLSGIMAGFSVFSSITQGTPAPAMPVLFDASGVSSEEQQAIAQFYIDNPLATAKEGHYAWVSAKEAAGWRRGDVYDAEKKLHPSLVVWEELPGHLQLKNSFTQQTVAQFVKVLPVNDAIKTGLEAVAQVAAKINHDSGSDS